MAKVERARVVVTCPGRNVDADDLIALAAPRPLFISAGNLKEDGWVDPHGSFIAAKHASPIFRLLGELGLVGDTTPAIDETAPMGASPIASTTGAIRRDPTGPRSSTGRQRSGAGRARAGLG